MLQPQWADFGRSKSDESDQNIWNRSFEHTNQKLRISLTVFKRFYKLMPLFNSFCFFAERLWNKVFS